MRERFLTYIRENDMLDPGGRVIVALSGGGDSVCLLHLLASCREELEIQLLAVHVHHGIRGDEAGRDASFARALCERLGVPFILRREDVPELAARRGLSLEEAGRETRYRIFEEERLRCGASCVAVAHHMDDSAETILNNLFRGTGLAGLSGIAPVRGTVIRPLLCFRRQEIEHYLEAEGIEYCSDSTNGELLYARNRIRHVILPAARQVNGRAVEHMVRAGAFIGEADGYFKRMAARIVDGECGRETNGREANEANGGDAGTAAAAGMTVAGETPEIRLSGETLLAQEPIAAAYVLREAVSRAGGSLRDFGAVHIGLLMELARRRTGASIDLPGGLRVHNEYGALCFSRETGKTPEPETGTEPGRATGKAPMSPGLIFSDFPREKGVEIPKNQYTKCFDYDKIKDTLSVRYRAPGDYFMLSSGGRKTLKAFMIDEKIPREQRDRILLLAEGSHILWIVGYRISEYYKVTDDTEHILQVRLEGGNTHG